MNKIKLVSFEVYLAAIPVMKIQGRWIAERHFCNALDYDRRDDLLILTLSDGSKAYYSPVRNVAVETL